MKKGIFITFEGPDGAGKTTQIVKLKEKLEAKGYDVVLTREPGGTNISEIIRELVLDKSYVEMHPMTEALLYAASRAQHVNEKIRPALDKGKCVICDRYIHSSIAYQGYGREIGAENIMTINNLATGKLMPDLTFFVMLKAEDSIDRLASSGKDLDRLEREKVEFFKRVENGYIKMSQEMDNIVILDANKTREELYEIIFNEFTKKFS